MKSLRFTLIMMMSLLVLSFSYIPERSAQKVSQLTGAWETTSGKRLGLWIITAKHFSISYYNSGEFLYTEGGEWKLTDDGIELMWEYNTQDKTKVGTSRLFPLIVKGDKLTWEKTDWKKIDDGTPGKLSGAWLITGRYQDGKISERTPGVRRTMKILSGKKFQWIAYNIETKEFFGTGGGSYTTTDGKYTESIEFFSRDNSRVGASLQFDYQIEEGKWRHSGKSSKGDPLDEIWTKRDILGI